MSALYEFVSDNYRVWDSCELLATDSIFITEIWMHHGSQKMITSHRRVSSNHIDAWLNQTSKGSNEDSESTIMLRLVWVESQHMEKVQHISPTVLDALLIHFHIELAYKWNWTCYAGSTKFSNNHSSKESRFSYSVCNHPKIATAWSYDVSRGLTQGIYFAPSGRVPELQSLVQSLADIAGHPMLPALVFGISLSGLVDRDHQTTKENVRAVEVRTKFHSWTSRNEAPAEGDYLTLSAMTAGAKNRIANLCQRTKILLDLCDFVEENLHSVGVDGKEPYGSSLTDIISLADEYTRVLRKRTMLQEADAKFFQHRADIQSQSLAILIAQDQARTNLDIASATRQDSLSLKTLSLVTMFFLPATFLATLFSIPLLDWNSEKNQLGDFWIYWVFAVPLTLATFGIWWIWTSILERKYKVQEGSLCSNDQGLWGTLLSWKRWSTNGRMFDDRNSESSSIVRKPDD